MSLRWLQDDFKRSRSRSSSSSSSAGKKQRVDEFGRTITKVGSSSRSRSHSRGRSRLDDWQGDAGFGRTRGYRETLSREKSKERGRRQKRRDGSSSSSSSSSSDNHTPSTRLVASNKPKYLNARLFVANIVANEIEKEELTKHFEKYGNVVDVLIHPKNYAFIQYLKEEHARLAVEGEQGSTLKGWRLDVKMANEGRRGAGGGRGGRGGADRGGRGSGGGRFNERDSREKRDRSPLSDRPFRGSRRSPGPYPPAIRDFGMRDPYFPPPDPYRRMYPDPWLPPDDPFRPVPYLDPYRDPFALRPPPPIVVECEVFMVNPQLRAYAEAIERRVKDQNIITAVSVIPEGRTSAQMVEELTARDGLFAIFINPQNEQHRSLTLNILHGVPQEHRNMPLDDAIALVGRSFEKYVEGLREKAKAAAAPLTARVFLPATAEVAYLLNLLADNRALTIDELNTVIKYLQERRDKLIDAESRPIVTDDGLIKPIPSQHTTEPVTGTSNEQISAQQDIKNKILSIFTSAGGSIQGVPPANGSNLFPSGTPAPPPPPPPAPAAASASLINFDNPNVQKALDNLIQSSPSLLKNFTSKVSVAATQAVSTSVSSSLSATVNTSTSAVGFGQGNVMLSNLLPHAGPQLQGRMPGAFGDMQGQRMPGNEQGGYGMQGPSGLPGQSMPRY
ncbi:nuclear receptor coactivator 5 [Biomphalaria glabrata]|uniref:RRM domain-containing protein n=1 Tax=Biomphalaria glabrata TaxID=6526 RepID=A0A2C9JXW0_BIOGL|nr:nuclear receptor coactivator 5-like [Biomphalaria glabrata]KAI8790690.1 nuclear receptor coactivator 5 [Biomphalaria glabrata]